MCAAKCSTASVYRIITDMRLPTISKNAADRRSLSQLNPEGTLYPSIIHARRNCQLWQKRASNYFERLLSMITTAQVQTSTSQQIGLNTEIYYRASDIYSRPATHTRPAHRGLLPIGRTQFYYLLGKGVIPQPDACVGNTRLWSGTLLHAAITKSGRNNTSPEH